MKLILKLGPYLLILLALSCTGKNEEAGVFRFYAKESVRSIDPILASDVYTQQIVGQIYEGLFHFHFLKRPVQVEPLLAEAMPEVSADGLIYKLRIKKGIYFHDDKVFKGKKRELTAADFIYSWKRIVDPRNRSENYWAFKDKIAGLDEWRELVGKGSANYDSPVEGLQSPGPFDLEIHLKRPYFQLLHVLSLGMSTVVPREAVEFYGQDFGINPVGTGPFRLGNWRTGSRLELVKNKNYHEQYYPSEGAVHDLGGEMLADAGKKLPLLDKIIIDEIPQEQPQWFQFLKGELDALLVPKDYTTVLLKNKTVAAEYQKKGIVARLVPSMDVTYIGFNTENRYFKNKKLRQAMATSYDLARAWQMFYSGLSVPSHGPIPPDLEGYRKDFKNVLSRYDLEAGKKLMMEAGYPQGKGLPTFAYDIGSSSTTGRQMAEFFQQQMAQLGIKIKIQINSWPSFNEKVRKKKSDLFEMAWNGDYPDADNFFQLFYGGNISPGPNSANFKNQKFDTLFEAARRLPSGGERTALYQQMEDVVIEEVPWIFLFHRVRVVASQGWVKNYQYHPMIMDSMKYYRIDGQEKKRLSSRP